MRRLFLWLPWFLLLPSLGWGADVTWPQMREVSASFRVDTKSEKIEIDLPLYDKRGSAQYIFWCRGGSERYLDDLSRQLRIDFVAPFSCRLNEGEKLADESLLIEDDSPIWHSRGQFRYEDLIGGCGDYPEFGRVRRFRLRGFELTIAASHVKSDDAGRVEQFRLDVSLKVDKSATGRIARRPDYLDPHSIGRSCKTILKGKDPRYCRDWAKGGSYERCRD